MRVRIPPSPPFSVSNLLISLPLHLKIAFVPTNEHTNPALRRPTEALKARARNQQWWGPSARHSAVRNRLERAVTGAVVPRRRSRRFAWTALPRQGAGPLREAISSLGPGGAGGFPLRAWVGLAPRWGLSVSPMCGCIFGCRGERPLRDIPADGTLVSVLKIAWKVAGQSCRKFDRANMWCAPIWEMENQDIRPHRTGKVARLMPAS